MPNRDNRRRNTRDAQNQPTERQPPTHEQDARLTPLINERLQSPYSEHDHQPYSHQGTNVSDENQEAANPYRRIHIVNIVLTLIFSALLLIVTVVYSYFSYGQWGAMEKTLDEARATRVIENRAYVNVKAVALANKAQPDGPFGLVPGQRGVAALSFINVGRTPAVGLTNTIACRVRDTPLPEPMTFEPIDSRPSVSVLGPTIESNLFAVTPDFLDEATVKAILEGRKHLYVYGLIRYSDKFDGKHNTGFCLEYSALTKTFVYCENNNYAD